MKKLLLSLFAVTAMGLSAYAANVTQTFSTSIGFPSGTNSNVPTGSSTVTDQNIAYTINLAYVNGSYLVLSKNGNTSNPASISWSLGFNCSEIQLTASNQTAGTSVDVYAGETKLETVALTASTAKTYNVSIPTSNQTAGTVYKIVNSSGKNAAFTSFTYVDATGSGSTTDPTDPTPGPTDPSDPTDDNPVTFNLVTGTYGITGQTPGATTNSYFDEGTMTSGNISISFAGTGGNNYFRFWSDGLRFYNSSNRVPSFTISTRNGGKILSVAFAGTSGYAVSVGGQKITSPWTGSESSVTFTYTGDNGKAISSIAVTYENGNVAVFAPSISFENSTNTVTLSCDTPNSTIYYTLNGDTPDNTSTQYSVPFQITSTCEVKAIAYVDNESSEVTSKECEYFGTFTNYTEYIAANPTNGGKVNGPITAVYQNGQYLYTVDNTGYPMLVYGNVGETFANGDQIEYVEGKYQVYSGLPEITSPTLGEVTKEGTPVLPETVEIKNLSTVKLNKYIKIMDVTVSGTTITDGSGQTATLYSRFSDVTIPTDTEETYVVEGFLAIYNSNLQIYPTSFTKSSGIDAIGTEVAPVEYYNLQGVKVQNPVKGQLYIIRQGKKAVKAIL